MAERPGDAAMVVGLDDVCDGCTLVDVGAVVASGTVVAVVDVVGFWVGAGA